MRPVALLLLAAPALSFAQPPAAKSPVLITEWTVPWEKTRPRDPFVDKNGYVWFVGQTGNYLATLDARTGAFKRYEIEAGTNPHNLIADPAGNIWYAGNMNARIGRLDARTGRIVTYSTGAAVKDPHTLVMDKLGNIWFTAQGANHVGHLTAKTGKVRVIPVPTPNSRPYGIVLDPTGTRPWFVEFGSNKIATIDPATMTITEHVLPNEKSRSRRIEITPDGMIWYADYMRGMLGRYDPTTRVTKEWAAPSGAQSAPYALAQDHRGRLWAVETGIRPNRLVAFDPKTESWFSETPIEKSGGLTVRHMVFHKPTRTLWFGTDAGTIARAQVPE